MWSVWAGQKENKLDCNKDCSLYNEGPDLQPARFSQVFNLITAINSAITVLSLVEITSSTNKID